MRPKRLPDSEFEIMELIWDREPPVTTAMIWDAIGREKGVKLQTIVTLVGRLVERGFLRFERAKGRERMFYPLLTREAYLQLETEKFVDHYHKKSYVSLLNALHREKLTREQIDELTQWIEDFKK